MEAALRALRMKDLKKTARVLGVSGDELDDAEDEEDAKAAVVALVLVKGTAFKALKPRELKAQARGLGVDADELDDCLDEDDPKEAMVMLMIKAAGSGAVAASPPLEPTIDEGTPVSDGLSPTPSSPGAASGEKKVMAVCVEIKQQLGLDGSINPAATAAAGREALGMPAAPAGTKLKDSLQQICLELGIETGWTGFSEGVPPEDGRSPLAAKSPPTRTASTSDVVSVGDGGSLAIKEVIGRGGQATVYRGALTEHGHTKTVAVKKLAGGSTQAEIKKFQTELMTLTRAAQRCEHVCRVMGATEHEGQLCIIMKEYVESMDTLLVREGALPIKRALEYGMQIIRGLVSLHAERILVLDLKPANVLVDEQDQLAISDFGLSHLSQATLSASRGVGGTPVFMSPEQFDSSQFGRPTSKADIWAFGCVLIALLQGHNPWKGLQDREIMMQVSVKGTSPAIPPGLPDAVADVVQRCLQISPKRRPAASDVVPLLNSAIASVAGGSPGELKLLGCPVGRSGRHIFLSYRRLDLEFAMNVRQALEALGYVVFMDVGESGLGAGDFQAQLEQVLKDTPVVVCLLTATLNADSGHLEFKRIHNKGDFVRLELRAALGMQKLIIPFFTAQFDIKRMIHAGRLPSDVVDLGKMNFVPHSVDYFDASIKKIHNFIEDEAAKGNLDALTQFDGELPPEPPHTPVDSPTEQDKDAEVNTVPRDPGAPMTKLPCPQASDVYTHADSLLRSSWAKKSDYKFIRLVEVLEISSPKLQLRYEAYKSAMPPDVVNGNEQLVFHGCANGAIDSIATTGFLRAFQTSAAGAWQRFGPGFYFALQASKSHEYPITEMQALTTGEHFRKMILCKVAKGKSLETTVNMDTLTEAPEGYHSVHGIESADGPLNYDELVVYDEAAVLPYAIVTYEFQKLSSQVVVAKQEATQHEQGQEHGGGSNDKSQPIDTLAELVKQSSVDEPTLLSYSKDDLRELMKDLGVTVVPRNAISAEVEKKQKESGLVRTQTFVELEQAKADVEKLKAEKEAAEAVAKAAQLKAEEEKVARDIAEAQAQAPVKHKCPSGHKLTHDTSTGSSGQAAEDHFCDICGSNGTEYKCSDCDFDMCTDCWDMSANGIAKVMKLRHTSLTETIAIMRTSASDAKVLGACCRQLAEIAEVDDDAKDTMRAAGVIDCVVDAMKGHRRATGLQVSAAIITLNLLEDNAENANALVDAGIIECVLDLARDKADDEMLSTISLSLIVKLLDECSGPMAYEQIDSGGALDLARQAAARFDDDTGVFKYLIEHIPIAWVRKGAKVSVDGRTGTCIMDPDSDTDVKVRWDNGGETSGYIKARALTRITQKDAKADSASSRVSVSGCDSPNCNGEFEYSGERNGRACYNRVGREGTLYFDGSFWKICQSGRSRDGGGESGWNFSQRPLDSDSSAKLPPAGQWSEQRHCSESRVDYSSVKLTIHTGAAPRQLRDKSGHTLEHHPSGRDTRWACDGKLFSAGCKSGITGFGQTAGMPVYSCRSCDLDFCVPCVTHYANERGVVSDDVWCVRGAMAKLEGRVGRIIMDPDGDSEVKLRWEDGNTSRYVRIIRLERASAAEKAAYDSTASADRSWIRTGVLAKCDGERIGRVTQDPDSDREVKLMWADGEASRYTNITRLTKPSDSERLSFERQTGQVQILTAENAKIGLRVTYGSSSGGSHTGPGNLLGWKVSGTRFGDTSGGLSSDGYCRIEFDNGGGYNVSMGGTRIIGDEPRRPITHHYLPVGTRVVRGPDWEWGDQDGGAGGTGTVVEHEGDRWSKVTWDHNGRTAAYKNGKDGKLDLKQVGGTAAGAGTGSPTDVVITITGAGFDKTNGTYKYHAMHEGKPSFQKQGGDGRIYFRDGCWATNEDSNFGYWEYLAPGNTPLPPSGTWPKRSTSGIAEPDRARDPRPTVTVRGGGTTTGETTVVVSGAGVSCCNGTYTLNPQRSQWETSSGEYLKPVYDSDWGWVMSDSSSTYQYFSDPSGRVDRITPPGIDFCPQKSFCPQHEGSIEVSWRGWTSRAKAGSMPTVTIIKGSGTSGVSGGHSGEWRGSAMSQWCSLSSSREGMLCTHGSEVLRHEHWSCCGATSTSAPCSATGSSSGGVDKSNPRSWCKRGAWASRDGKIGKVTMDPDSDSEVKLVWPDGETSGYIKIDRLEYVGEGRHSSHRHTLAPCERRGWNCDVCRASNPGGARFRCTQGCDYDVCASCWSTSSSSISVGSRVRVKPSVSSPKYGWGDGVDASSVGTVVSISGDSCKIDFPRRSSNWTGAVSEMEVVAGSGSGHRLRKYIGGSVKCRICGMYGPSSQTGDQECATCKLCSTCCKSKACQG